MSIYESWEDIPAFEYVNSVVYPSKHRTPGSTRHRWRHGHRACPVPATSTKERHPGCGSTCNLNRDVVSVVMPRESVALLHGQLADWLGMTVTDPETKRARGKR